MRHLGEALDTVRKSEYARLAGRDRRYIKGQKYTLLSRSAGNSQNLSGEVRDLCRQRKNCGHDQLKRPYFALLSIAPVYFLLDGRWHFFPSLCCALRNQLGHRAMSEKCRYCCKSRKSSAPQNVAKVDF
jgi:hypothetical protein